MGCQQRGGLATDFGHHPVLGNNILGQSMPPGLPPDTFGDERFQLVIAGLVGTIAFFRKAIWKAVSLIVRRPSSDHED